MISELQGLTNLKQLSLYNNEIEDINPLEGLKSLTDLDTNSPKGLFFSIFSDKSYFLCILLPFALSGVNGYLLTNSKEGKVLCSKSFTVVI